MQIFVAAREILSYEDNLKYEYNLKYKDDLKYEYDLKYQPSSEGGTRSLPAKSKMAARGPQNAQGVWKDVYI